MEHFIDSIVSRVVEIQKKHTNVTVIFPNKRAGLFFQKALVKNTQQAKWSPEVMSIEDLVLRDTQYIKSEKFELLWSLYEVYKKHFKGVEVFDQYFFWGEMLLKDFDEIDRYLVPARLLYTNLRNQKELDRYFEYLTEDQKRVILKFWRTFENKITPQKEAFEKIWDSLYAVYTEFTTKLHHSKTGYYGLIIRHFYEEISSFIESNQNYIVFCGFNALTKTESGIIKRIVSEKQGEVLWDADTYYFSNPMQEAGVFMRDYSKYKGLSGNLSNLPSTLTGQSKDIELISAPSLTGQAQILKDQLEKHKTSIIRHGFENTVVVLPDERLLFPVLNALPNWIDVFNITMGFPIVSTPVYSLVTIMLQIQEAIRGEGNKRKLYFKPFIRLLNHPTIKRYYPEAAQVSQMLKMNNQVYIEADLMQENALVNKICQNVAESNTIEYLLGVVAFIANSAVKEEGFELEFLGKMYVELGKLNNVMLQAKMQLSIKSIKKLLGQVLKNVKVNFSGEPLKGLQIMGVLETRNLDFEHVFMLSTNEGVLPSPTSGNSYIPYNIRSAYELPLYEQQDAVFAYLFYRLFQRSSVVSMVYLNSGDRQEESEVSRFVKQLKYESGLSIKEKSYGYLLKGEKEKKLVVKKDQELMQQIQRQYIEGDQTMALTPSALNTYMDCRIRFYFKYLAKIKEPEELQEDIDPAVLGNIFHHAMELLYLSLEKKKKNALVEKNDRKELESCIESTLSKAFLEHYQLEGEEFFYEGRNVLIKEVVIIMMKKVIEVDMKYAPFSIVGLENEYFYRVPLSINGSQKEVPIKGIIDRVDEKEGTIRVVDYKTGIDKNEFGSLEGLFERHSVKQRNKGAFQTMFYSLLYQVNHSNNHPIQAGLYSTREMFDPMFNPILKLKSSRGRYSGSIVQDVRVYLKEYEVLLQTLVQEIVGSDQVFDQTPNISKCEHCPYKNICSR